MRASSFWLEAVASGGAGASTKPEAMKRTIITTSVVQIINYAVAIERGIQRFNTTS